MQAKLQCIFDDRSSILHNTALGFFINILHSSAEGWTDCCGVTIPEELKHNIFKDPQINQASL